MAVVAIIVCYKIYDILGNDVIVVHLYCLGRASKLLLSPRIEIKETGCGGFISFVLSLG